MAPRKKREETPTGVGPFVEVNYLVDRFDKRGSGIIQVVLEMPDSKVGPSIEMTWRDTKGGEREPLGRATMISGHVTNLKGGKHGARLRRLPDKLWKVIVGMAAAFEETAA